MTVDTTAELALLGLDLDGDLVAEVEAFLCDPARTAHRLVSLPTAQLVEQALGGQPAAVTTGPALPGGVWRVLPDRLLTLHPGRRAERLDRLRIPVAQHLQLTATVLEQWGWTRAGRNRAVGGGRCILGAQHALYRLGWGTEHTAVEAGRRIDGVLAARGVREPYPAWNDRQQSAEHVIAVVREAAGVT
jgi:hypothetical protein